MHLSIGHKNDRESCVQRRWRESKVDGELDDDAPADDEVDDEAVADAGDASDCRRKYLRADGRQKFYDIFI